MPDFCFNKLSLPCCCNCLWQCPARASVNYFAASSQSVGAPKKEGVHVCLNTVCALQKKYRVYCKRGSSSNKSNNRPALNLLLFRCSMAHAVVLFRLWFPV
ncbi:hypothetical protein ABBQ32_004244 [Trebouxia sp. C0010 RCD-2024]